MRGAFVHTYDAYYGPLSTMGAPNTQYVYSQPCRFVPQTKVFQAQEPFGLADAWMTHNAPSLNGPDVIAPWVPATFSDYLTADQVIVSAHPLKRFVYCRSEFVNPVVRPSYWRGLLIDVAKLVDPPWLPPSPLPPPPVPPAVCVLPAPFCGAAVVAPLGTTCTYIGNPLGSYWWHYAVDTSQPVTATFTLLLGAIVWTVYVGFGCGSLSVVGTGFGFGAVTLTCPPGMSVWIEVQVLPPAPGDFQTLVTNP